MAERGAPLKVLVKSPFSQYSGYGNDGFGIIRALQRWGCDVYPQPTWVDVPIPADVLPLFSKTLRGPFDLLINHWDPEHLEITRSAREMSRIAVGWTMWEFCLSDSTEIFTRRGWLRYDQLTASDQTLGINPETGLSEWQPVEHVNVFDGERDMVSYDYRCHRSLSTLQHRWLVRSRSHGKRKWAWRTTETLKQEDQIPRAAFCADLPAEQKYADAFVELVAWAYTEGWLERGRQLRIGQNERVYPGNCQRIRAALSMLGQHVARNSPQPGDHTWSEGFKADGMVHFNLSQAVSDELMSVMPGKVPSHEFLLSLTRAQLDLFLSVSSLADGNGDGGFSQTLGPRMEAFIFACVLAGRVVWPVVPSREHPHLGTVSVSKRQQFASPEGAARQQPGVKQVVRHEGRVWCPTVPLGNWLCRYEGHIFYTGNSGGPGPRYDEKAQELKKAKPDMSDDEIRERGGIVVPGPVSGLLPLCGRVYDTETPEGDPQQDGLYSRLRWYDLVLGYDQVSLDAITHYLPPKTAGAVLQGGYEARDWSYIDRDWHGDRFQFLMHGALNNRKQPWLAIEAFQKLKYEKGDAFAGARLALHTNAPGTLFPELNEPFKPFGIKVFVDTWDMSTLRDFYAAGHCLLAPSKGEGKNLPALEFGTTGGAVIATNYSGHVQWIGGDWAYPLDYKLAPTFSDHPWGAHSAEVDLNYLADTMWHVFTHRAEAEAKGRLASQLFPKMCDWSIVIEKFFEKIRDNVPKVGPQVYDAAMACRRPEQEPVGRILA